MRIFFVSIVLIVMLMCQAWGQHFLVKTKDDNKTFLIKTGDDHDEPMLTDLEDNEAQEEERSVWVKMQVGMYLFIHI